MTLVSLSGHIFCPFFSISSPTQDDKDAEYWLSLQHQAVGMAQVPALNLVVSWLG
jgi:hypothetical protein